MASLRLGDRFPRAGTVAVGLLCVLGTLLRLRALRSLPIFGDEAIFLRLAELVRKNPGPNLWNSLQAAYPPLHTWLLALWLPVSDDPVRAGRLLSAVIGILTIPVAAWTAWQIAQATEEDGSGREGTGWMTAIGTCAMVSVSPFFVFAQRIARVDALFLLETVLVAGLSVLMARRVGASTVASGVEFGVVMGLTMLTRQAVSYPLWLMPVLAQGMTRRGSGSSRRMAARRLAVRLAIAAAVALILWIPLLLARAGPDTMTRIFFEGRMRPGMAFGERIALGARNVRLAGESLWTYLTPPVACAAVASLAWLSVSRRWRLLGFLVAWEAIVLGPVVLYAVSFFPRYALAAAFPAIVAASLGAARVWSLLEKASSRRFAPRAIGLALCAVLLGWGVRDILAGQRDWRRWRLRPADREQFIHGWSAGFASEAAIQFLAQRALEGPLTVLLPEFAGNPSDAVWLLLSRQSGVRLAYAIDALRRPLLTAVAGQPETYELSGDIREGQSTSTLRADGPVYVVSTDPLLTRSGWLPASQVLMAHNPALSEAARFDNPPGPDGRVESSIVVFRVR